MIKATALILQVVFITLKLIGLISWSWWYVMSPFIIFYTIDFLVAGVLLLLNWKLLTGRD